MDRGHRQVGRHHPQHLQPLDHFPRTIGVHGGHRPVVAGVHGLDHVQRFGAAALTHQDPVGSHAQGVFHQVAYGVLADPLDVRGLGLQCDNVFLVEPQLGGVFDGDDSFLERNEAAQDV